MAVKILIVDPDIGFIGPIKRSLETLGDFRVNVFASGRAALEMLERETHDVALLDFAAEDVGVADLIAAIRHVQPWVYIMASPRSPDQVRQLADLDIQGHITKPYYARQLVPLIRAAAAARARQAGSERAQELARLPDLTDSKPIIVEPRIGPDDTFRRVIATLGANSAALAQDEPPLPEHATVRDLMTGKTPLPSTDDTQPSKPVDLAAHLAEDIEVPAQPDLLPESPPPDPADQTAGLAAVALEIAADDTLRLAAVPAAFDQRVESLPPETRPPINPLALWIHAEDLNAPTLVPDVSPAQPATDMPAGDETLKLPAAQLPAAPSQGLNMAAIFRGAPPTDSANAPGTPDAEQPESEEMDEEMAHTFGALLGQAPQPPEMPTAPPPAPAPANDIAVRRALALLGVESVDELEPDPAEEESANPLAGAALGLTQMTTQTTAHASILSQGRTLVAHAGKLGELDLRRCMDEIALAWEGKPFTPTAAALFRYIELPSGADFLLYSTPTAGRMTLTMLFPGDVPLRVIRRQTRVLIDALTNTPDRAADAEAEAARTLPSRPTALRPPSGLRDALDTPVTAPEAPAPAPAAEAPAAEAPELLAEAAAPETPPAPQRPNVPYVTHAFAWLPGQSAFSEAQVQMIPAWLRAAAEPRFWDIDGVEAQPTHVVFQLRAPESDAPSLLSRTLQGLVAEIAAAPDLWTSTYYVVSGGRAITPTEIASLIEFQREASQGVA